MRMFALLNLQHVILYILPTLIFMLVFAIGLGFVHFKDARSRQRLETIANRFPDGIEDRHSPFPLVMTLTIAGTFLWAFFYILFYGLLGVQI